MRKSPPLIKWAFLVLHLILCLNLSAVSAKTFTTTRRNPPLFTSTAINEEIERVKNVLADKDLAEIFELCYPNTLDTTGKSTFFLFLLFLLVFLRNQENCDYVDETLNS